MTKNGGYTQMRKHVLVAVALGTAVFGVLPMTAVSATTNSPAKKSAVLTVGKVGGTAVKRGAILKASLKSGTSVTFYAPGTKNGVTCKSSSFTDRVTKNPQSPGIARELLTAQTFGGCSVHGVGGAIGVKGITVANLPYKTTISGVGSHPIVLFKARTRLTLKTVLGTLTCTYAAATVKGTASNVGQVNIFTDQTFTLLSGSVACPKKGSFSATFGPVKDTSAKNSPHVYVN